MATYQDIPRQKLSISKKTKQWKQDCVDAYINISSLGGYGVGFSTRRGELQRLYDFYNGDISENDYDYVLKPYGKTRKNFPSKLRNYPIIKPIIDLLLGEKAKRPFNYTVSVANSDSVSIKEEALNEMIYKNLEQTFINQVNESGADTGVPSQEVEAPEQIRELFNRSYVDNRAIVGQAALNYIMEKQEVHDKLQQAWFHFLISGEVYTERGVRNAEPFYDILNPLDVDYDLDPDLEFVEDGDWAVTRKFMHASTIIDNYYGYLKDSEVDQLESPTRNKVDNFLTYSSYTENSDPFRSNLIEVTTVYWKSRKRVGLIQQNVNYQLMGDVILMLTLKISL